MGSTVCHEASTKGRDAWSPGCEHERGGGRSSLSSPVASPPLQASAPFHADAGRAEKVEQSPAREASRPNGVDGVHAARMGANRDSPRVCKTAGETESGAGWSHTRGRPAVCKRKGEMHTHSRSLPSTVFWRYEVRFHDFIV